MDLELTEKVKDFTRSQGVDLVGVASVESLWGRHQKDIEESFPKAKNILVFGIRHARAAITSDNLRLNQFNAHHTFAYIETITHHLVNLLDRGGYGAAGITPSIPVSVEKGKSGYVGDISFRHAAVEAGLGHLGIHRLVMTPEFGPRVRFGVVLSDAPLVPDEAYKGKNYCYDCQACIKACPAGAISKEGVDVVKCAPVYAKYGWSGTFSLIEEILRMDNREDMIKRLKSRDAYLIWQSITNCILYHCFECMKICARVMYKKFGI